MTTVWERVETAEKTSAEENPEACRNHRIVMANSLRFDGADATKGREAKRENSGLEEFLLPFAPAVASYRRCTLPPYGG